MAAVAAPNPGIGHGWWMNGPGKLAGDMWRGDSKSFGREGEAGHSGHFNISAPASMQLRTSILSPSLFFLLSLMFVLLYG